MWRGKINHFIDQKLKESSLLFFGLTSQIPWWKRNLIDNVI
jgi:hypothetical protein